MRDGVIQRFEYTFELSWKMIKRYLEIYSLEKPDGFTNTELFRMGFEQGLIDERKRINADRKKVINLNKKSDIRRRELWEKK